ncbi:potassium channel subfamily K member 1-like [Erythrolamprus reginae]|uniref:potassium channel subfamily K member 1-like n=1 Tax=Erythrolamprus reginae TaxID=121349 RepID=UPI00396CCD81
MEPAWRRLRRPGRFELLLGAYGLYLLLGAAVLAALEAPAERALVTALHAARASLLAEHRRCLSGEQLSGLLRRVLAVRWGFPRGHVALGHSVGLGLATLTLFMVIPAICFWVLKEKWTFLDSIYFCFISLSTIGLGDFVPHVTSPPALKRFYEMTITCYLLTGVLAMLVTLETINQLQEVRALLHFFAPSRRPTLEDEDRVGIVTRDQLALSSNLEPCSPKALTERGAP